MYSKEIIEQRRQELERRFTPWKPMTVGTFFEKTVSDFGDREFIFTLEKSYTYKETKEIVDNLAKGLIKLGIKRREHIMGNIANWPEVLFLRFACAKIGCVFVSINVRASLKEFEYLARHSDVSCIVTMNSLLGKDYMKDLIYMAIPNLKEHDPSEKIQTEKFPKLRHVVTVSKNNTNYPGTLDFYGLVNMGKNVPDEVLEERFAASQNSTELYDLCYTSGTTGEAKGCLIRHEGYIHSGYGWQYTCCAPDGRRSYVSLPLNHTFALTESLFPSMYVGGCICMQEVFRLPEAYEIMEKGRVWDVPAVPTMMVAILDHPDRKKYNLSSIKSVEVAAAPAPIELWRRMVEELNLEDIKTAYGQTETSGGSGVTPPDMPLELLPRYVGEPRMGGVSASSTPYTKGKIIEYKVVDPVTGEDLPEGSVGELAARGTIVVRGYYKNPEETAKLVDKDGWLRSGDLAVIKYETMTYGDVRPFIQLVGRSKELYIMGGENVSPLEVEHAISKYPKVAQVYVAGVPDLKMSEVGAAYVELLPGQECTKEELLSYCKEALASFKIPKYIEFVKGSEFPLTASGKVQKFKLRDRAIETYGLQEAARQLESLKYNLSGK